MEQKEAERIPFGSVDGKTVFLYTLSIPGGIQMKVTNYGCIVTSLFTPDNKGVMGDVVLGYDSLAGYLKSTPYFGAVVGRYANRIANGKFVVDGKEFILACNNGPNHLHGGLKGFDKVVWKVIESTPERIHFRYLSKDGEEGYPGNLTVDLIYSLNPGNEFRIEYEARTDKACPVNLSHHSYFNLAGGGMTGILGHRLMILADRYTVVNENLIPTGELGPVKGTPMDFLVSEAIGKRIGDVPGGYDHNYVLNNGGTFSKVAEVLEPVSGRVMEVYSDQPGLQFYSGNFLDGSITGKQGRVYGKHHGFCLEAQHFPDSPNQTGFPNTVLKPGEVYRQVTAYKFPVR